MQQIIYFFQKFKYFLFFLLLQLIAIGITFNNLNFQKSKFVNSANSITGGMYEKVSDISEYLHLKSINNQLLEENRRLRTRIFESQYVNFSKDSIYLDTTKYFQKYTYTTAKIINNNYSNSFNFLTISKGSNQGIKKDLAVINSKGVVGIVDNVNDNYARIQSVLNKNTNLNARLKGTRYFGTLNWNAKDYRIMQLIDIPRQARLQVGDTIETDGKSAIFPEGILIGTVVGVNKKNVVGNTIDVKLFNDMSNIGPVYIVKNLHKKEIKILENIEIE